MGLTRWGDSLRELWSWTFHGDDSEWGRVSQTVRGVFRSFVRRCRGAVSTHHPQHLHRGEPAATRGLTGTREPRLGSHSGLIDGRPSNRQPLQFRPTHLWPVTAVKLLSCIEPEKWPTPLRPPRNDTSQTAGGGEGHTPVRDRRWWFIPKLYVCIRNRCTDWIRLSLCSGFGAISRLSGAAGGRGGGAAGGRYLRRIRETWWMTQYFHARGKLLHFKLEGVTEREGRRQRRKEINPQE